MEVVDIVAKGKYIAVRPNNIVEARYDLTSKQNDILDMVLSEVQDDDKYLYELNLDKYRKLYRKGSTNIYRDLKTAIKEFEGKGFYLTKPSEGKQIFFVWFASIFYSDNEGKIVVEVGKQLKEILLKIKEKTFYRIEYPINFTSIYSKRMYYYLKRFEDTGWRKDNLGDLREKMQCPKSYEKYSFFKMKVLQQAQKEINEYSDIYFDFEEIKEGRKVVALKFFIHSNKKAEEKEHAPEDNPPADVVPGQIDAYEYIEELATTEEDPLDQVIRITEGQLTIASVKTILKVAKNDIELIKEKYELSKQHDDIQDLGAWLYWAIENNFKGEKSSTGKPKNKKGSKKTFSNFKERNYTTEQIREMEEKLIKRPYKELNEL